MKILQTISAVTFLGILSLSGQDVMAMEALKENTNEDDRPSIAPSLVSIEKGLIAGSDGVQQQLEEIKRRVQAERKARRRLSGIQRLGDKLIEEEKHRQEQVRNLEKQLQRALDENTKLNDEKVKFKADLAAALEGKLTMQEALIEEQEKVKNLERQVADLGIRLAALQISKAQPQG